MFFGGRSQHDGLEVRLHHAMDAKRLRNAMELLGIEGAVPGEFAIQGTSASPFELSP
jgi:hypothetical protein